LFLSEQEFNNQKNKKNKIKMQSLFINVSILKDTSFIYGAYKNGNDIL